MAISQGPVTPKLELISSVILGSFPVKCVFLVPIDAVACHREGYYSISSGYRLSWASPGVVTFEMIHFPGLSHNSLSCKVLISSKRIFLSHLPSVSIYL